MKELTDDLRTATVKECIDKTFKVRTENLESVEEDIALLPTGWPKLGKSMRTLKVRMALHADTRRLGEKLIELTGMVKTVEELVELWPDAEKFIPSKVPEKLPRYVELVSDINQIIANENEDK